MASSTGTEPPAFDLAAVACIGCRCYTYTVEFEWDAGKAAGNEHKHGVGFMEASTCFWDPLQVAFYDPDHSDEEDREIVIAHSAQERLLVVVYTFRGKKIRIISARQATRKEARDYARGI